ncbi:hypothetical protein FJZ19_02805 [Candidatus Pacearchaeota archaeon]|nr:hypothetical protein [Candidatus Pacearchaeota archaeon]
MNEYERTMLGISLFAFSIAMLSVCLEGFHLAGAIVPTQAYWLVGFFAGILMVAFFIVAVFILYGYGKA